MTPAALRAYLERLVSERLFLSTMIWGPPGIGKSSIVAQTATAQGLEFIDVRLSQLAPTDLRGLPVPDAKAQISRWYPPEFLPRANGAAKSAGILFLDEINMARPAMQGMAQQLILDRRVGATSCLVAGSSGPQATAETALLSSICPRRWRIASSTSVKPDWDSFKRTPSRKLAEQIIAFLSYRRRCSTRSTR